MKKLLVTAALGLGLGGGAWKYQNPEGTLEDFQVQAKTQATSTVDRLRVGVDAIRASKPGNEQDQQQAEQFITEQNEQPAAVETRQEAEAKALEARLAKIEQFVLSPNEDQSTAEATVSTNANAMQVLDEQANVQAGKQAEIQASVDTLESDVETLQASIQEMQVDIPASVGSLESTVDTLQASIQTMQADMPASVGSLESTIETLQASIRNIQAERPVSNGSVDSSAIQSLQASIQTIEESNATEVARLDAIDGKLDLLVRRIEEQTFDTDITSLKEGLQVLGADLLEVQSALDQQETKRVSELAGVNEQTQALDNRLDTLALLAQQNKTTGEEQSSQASTDVSAPALASLSASIDERFGALEDRLQTVNSDSRRLGGLNEQLETVQEEITALKTQYANTDLSLAEISTSLEGIKTSNESMSIETVQTEIREQLASVQSQLENERASDNSSELEALIGTTRNRILTLEQRVQELPASSDEADAALQSQSALKSQVAALEKRLETINQTDPDLVNTLSSVQQQVEKLTAQGFITKEDLKAQSEGRTIEYKIYFDSNSSSITDGAAKVLNSFIVQEKNRTTGVSIFGFTDRSGSAVYNQKLAEQRATNVRSYLIQNGMDYTSIKALTGLGEDAAAAILPDNAEDSQQRVVVLYAEQP